MLNVEQLARHGEALPIRMAQAVAGGFVMRRSQTRVRFAEPPPIVSGHARFPTITTGFADKSRARSERVKLARECGA